MINAHVADVYMFCVHTTAQDEPYDGLDIAVWEFYVLPGTAVARTKQKSMALSTVVRLGGTRLRWRDLARATQDAALLNVVMADQAAAPAERRTPSDRRDC